MDRARNSRSRKQREKEAIIVQRGYKNYTLESESIAEFEYSPNGCQKSYRMVVLRKSINVKQGQLLLFDETRYFFYITNLRDLTCEEIVWHANDRCDQDRLIEQLKNGSYAMRMPLGDLLSNLAASRLRAKRQRGPYAFPSPRRALRRFHLFKDVGGAAVVNGFETAVS